MISSSDLAKKIWYDLDQNAYTSWHDAQEIISVINSACEFLLAYTRRPRSLCLSEVSLQTAWNLFTLPSEIFYPYWADIDGKSISPTNIPIVWLANEDSCSFYAVWNTVKTKTLGKDLKLLYHRWHNPITSLAENDLDFPHSMFEVLKHLALWFIYPSGLDLWATLANNHYNMATALLWPYSKAYWFNLQAQWISPRSI